MIELSLAALNCSYSGYGLNTFFFEKTNEYIFSCVDDNSHFYMKRINSFSQEIEDDNIFHGKQFTECKNYSLFSIVYISQYNKNSTMINANCSGKDSKVFFWVIPLSL